ncbi:hypothetical protein [Hymenobacter cellulosilyticus]|uniref:DUF4369 domain-containing protein n=1 Tax=Hymenobacter cellulosilyticus TaxID=2932248 RepID=A0A8T9QAC0_9BACT|nr:hypothetical protein [Hymenobacter cellulosilyticus]UOQ71843.1 hypothetical protein MUN79_25110 [Hymenobacter cellulosilyticus]
MKKSLLLAASLLLSFISHITQAQSLFNSFEPGSYIPAGNPTQRVEGSLKLRGCTELLVKTGNGKTKKLGLDDVQSFRLGSQQFIKAGGFPVDKGLDGDTIDQAFVEQVDSGQVVLMRLHYIVAGPAMVGATGVPTGGNRSYELYLLRKAGETTITPLPASSLTGSGKKFREALLPYLAGRSDLTKLVTDKLITIENLPKLIHALNSGATDGPVSSPTTTN